MITSQILIPAGKYFVGDPCYFVPAADWGPLLDATNCMREPGHVRGLIVAAHNTQHGDGGYMGSNGFDFSVDSGMIGVTDARLCPDIHAPPGVIVDVKAQTYLVSHDHGKRIELVGYVTIDTSGDGERCPDCGSAYPDEADQEPDRPCQC